MILKYILYFLTVCITSLYYFPFEFKILPGTNTKMVLAATGIILLGVSLIKKRNQLVDKNFIQLSLYALVTSLIAFIAITFNDTPDTAYTTYIISMVDSSAFCLCVVIRLSVIVTQLIRHSCLTNQR